jgi:ceramide glucosyltransferase
LIALVYAALAFAGFALFMHLLSAWIAAHRLIRPTVAYARTRPVTIIRPLSGMDYHTYDCLQSTFDLNYPGHYEIIFCVDSENDPVVPLVKQLQKKNQKTARLLATTRGTDNLGPNPKLNNLYKGYRAAAHDFIIIPDANVLLPKDYIQRMFVAWYERPNTGMVCAPPIGSDPRNWAAELEVAILNSYQARWQYLADTFERGFAQGKNMMFRKDDLECAEGLETLTRDVAEDAAATKVIRGMGLKVRLADGGFFQPLGLRLFKDVWLRQLRWAKLRRATFPSFYVLEIFSGLLTPLFALLAASYALGQDVLGIGLAYVVSWFIVEWWLTITVEWHISWRMPFMWALREVLIPAIWVASWFGNRFEWRGHKMELR